MTIRSVFLAVALTGVALAPASAAAREGAAGDVAERLSDPAAQMAAAAAMAAIAETILNMDIAPFTRAIDAAGGGRMTRDLPADARLRDLAGPDAERMPRKIARSVPRVMGSAGQMASTLDEMMPQLREAARRMKDALPEY